MQFLAQYGLFLAQAATIVAAILLVAGGLLSLALRQKKSSDGELKITLLNDVYEQMEHDLSSALLTRPQLKLKAKQQKQKKKQETKAEKQALKAEQQQQTDAPQTVPARLFVLDFDGDIRASGVDFLREEISAILTCANPRDEVLVRLESSGGMVHSYGLAASQLQRLRDRQIPLTIAVDKVAASGGYMMACVANKVLAAPFAIIGSIGVLTQIPNLHRLLKKSHIDFEQLQAGEHKRTLTLFGKNTDQARKKMQQQLEETHQHFKDFIKSVRPGLDIDRVATGEHWLASRAKQLGLVDELTTSDDYLMARRHDARLLRLEYDARKSLLQKLQAVAMLRRQHGKWRSGGQPPMLM